MRGIIIAILILSGSTAFARIGESLMDCEERYGEPIKVEDDKAFIRAFFEKSGYFVVIEFIKPPGYAEKSMESVKKLSLKADLVYYSQKEHELLPERAVTNFLSANAGGFEWTQEDANVWIRSDDQVHATWTGKALVLRSKEYDIIQKRMEQESEKKEFEGF